MHHRPSSPTVSDVLFGGPPKVCRGLRPAMKPISTDDGTHEVREAGELRLWDLGADPLKDGEGR